jgi:leucyl aminopeptidase
MSITIKSIATMPQNGSFILLANKESEFQGYGLEKEEIDYIKTLISNKEKKVCINKYDHWIYLQILDYSKERSKLLEEARIAASEILEDITKAKIQEVTIVNLHNDGDEITLAYTEGLVLSGYQFIKYLKDKSEKEYSLKQINIFSKKDNKTSLEQLQHTIDAVYIARDLINEPVNHLNATKLAEEFEELGHKAGFSVEILEKKKIESLKMGGLLAVNKGSIDPPTFSILEWRPKDAKNQKPVVLVGKGITYDTGGLSLKPTPDCMDSMKSDMSGAAAIAATLYAAAKSKLPVHIIGLIPATDNRPSGNAMAPGDIITMHDGTTVEMLNSDAEGRLILSDAVSFAKKYDPELIIEISTLTGAAARAIGHHGIVGMGTASRITFDKIIKSGETVYERIVEFPFWEEYDELLKSDIADIKNSGGEYGGAIAGGKFIAHFTTAPYIHLDIAGPAYLKHPDHYRGKNATGTGIRLLFDFLKNY